MWLHIYLTGRGREVSSYFTYVRIINAIGNIAGFVDKGLVLSD